MTIFRHRSLLIVSAIAIAAPAVVVSAAPAAVASRSRGPVRHTRPKITGQPVVGTTLRAWPGHWSHARALTYSWERCNAAGARCKVIRTGHAARAATGRRYRLTNTDVGHRLRVIVRATNAFGSTSATSRVTAVIKTLSAAAGQGQGQGSTPSPGPAPPGTAPNPSLFTLVPSSGDGSAPAGIPRSDAACAAAVTPTAEKRPSNTTDNNTVPADPSAIQWNSAYSTWPAFVADRNQVTGDFKGTTDEIIQWAACKWGLDVNVARADAWLESGWYMSTRSGCSVPDQASFGLFQIVANACGSANTPVHGGYPYVADDTALNADYWGAWIRGCFDGAFLVPGYPWQNSPAQGYKGQSMAQVVAQNGEYYALWGCIGAWFSNAWYSSSAQGYIATVQKDEAAQPWLQPGT
jgi:hypothetical protein